MDKHNRLLFVVVALAFPSLARADELGAGFRWGFGVAPSVVVAATPTHTPSSEADTYDSHGIAWGVTLPIVRLGYAFPQYGRLSVSLYLEPRLGLHATTIDDQSAALLTPAGSAVLQLGIGRYFFVALGPSVGGQIAVIGDQTARGPAMGGFTLRIGANFLVQQHLARPRAVTVALESLAMFAPADVLDSSGRPLSNHQQGTGSLTTIGLSVGYDAL